MPTPATTAYSSIQTTPSNGNDAATAFAPVTTPGAYPYTTLDADRHVAVDSTGGARTVRLKSGTTRTWVMIEDAGDNAATNNITVSLEDAAKKLNGTVGGTATINVNGGIRAFTRDTNGNWRGGG